MTSDERTLISTLFDRLNSAAAQPKDPQADEYIRTKVSQQPSAPYLLVQSTLVMQQALTAAQTRIADLENQLAAAQRPGRGAKRKLPFRRGQPLWSWAITSAASARTANSAAASVSICTLVPAFPSSASPDRPRSRLEAAFCRAPSRQQPAWLAVLCFSKASRICWVTIQGNLED